MNCDNANCPEDDGCGWEFDNAGTWSSEGVIEVECGQAPPSPPFPLPPLTCDAISVPRCPSPGRSPL